MGNLDYMASVRGVYASIGCGSQSHFSHTFTAGLGRLPLHVSWRKHDSTISMTISAFYRTRKLRFNVPQTYFVFNYTK